MNKTRREEIKNLSLELTTIRCRLETLRDEEQDYNDSLPDNLRESARANASDDALEALDEAVDMLEQIESSLDEVGSEP